MKIIYKSDDGTDFETLEEVQKYEELPNIYIVYYQPLGGFDKCLQRIFSTAEAAQKYINDENPIDMQGLGYWNRYSFKKYRVYD